MNESAEVDQMEFIKQWQIEGNPGTEPQPLAHPPPFAAELVSELEQ